MQPALHWLAVGTVAAAALAAGICAHELLHVVPLSLVDADYSLTVLPSDDAPGTAWTALRSLSGGLVRVEVTRVPDATPGWVVRAAAVLPVALALPLLLTAAGALPDRLAANDLATAAMISLAGCAIPSPADWAAFWHGTALLED